MKSVKVSGKIIVSCSLTGLRFKGPIWIERDIFYILFYPYYTTSLGFTQYEFFHNVSPYIRDSPYAPYSEKAC